MFEIFAIASAIFGGASVMEQQKAAKAAKRADQTQRQMSNLRAAKERRSAIRDARLSYAAAQQNAENQGVGGSSGAQGGQGSIMTQGNANLSFLDQQQGLANLAGSWMDKSANASMRASAWGGLSKLAGAGASYFGSQPAAQPTVTIPRIPTAQNNYNLFPAQQIGQRRMESTLSRPNF